MSTLLQTLLGRREDRAKSVPMPPRFLWVLTAAIWTNYLSNAFASPITSVMLQGKWVALGVLAITAAYMLSMRPSPKFPVLMVLPMFALFVVSVVGSWGSHDFGFTLLSVLTVTSTIVAGYYISALIVATNSRRAFFELLAISGRIIVGVSALMMIAGINLGRGGGVSAWSDNPNTLAGIIAPLLVIFVAGCIERRPGWLVWHALFFVVGFYLVWATDARASTLWVLISLAGFWLYRRGPGFSVIAMIIGLIILIGWWFPIKEFVIEELGLRWSVRDTGISPLSGREEVWRVGWDLFWKRPFLGYGLGTSQELVRTENWRFVRHQGLHFHSSYITLMVELGAFGLIAMGTALFVTLSRAIGHSGATRILPRESWPVAALPFAIIVGALAHGMFESWLLAAGNANMLLFWTFVWMVHHQSQLSVRRVVTVRGEPPMPRYPAAPLPAR